MRALLDKPSSGVIVTGGASGIGLASAEALATIGRPIAIWDINGEQAELTASNLAERYQVPTAAIAIDLSDLDAIEPALATTRQALPSIGAMVHAAGVVLTTGLDGLTAENWSQVMDVNLRAMPFLIKAILPDLRANPGAAIVGIASINASLGSGMIPAYSAAKGGMLALVRSLADALAQDGIRINALSPGMIQTPMIKSVHDSQPPGTFESRVFMARLGLPEEIGRVVRFLLSEEASYIMGTEIVVDGGNIPSQRINPLAGTGND